MKEHKVPVQSLIDHIKTATDVDPWAKEMVEELLKEQEEKTGYWIDSAGNDKCSNCGAEYSDLYPDYGNTHFCPNCGAKMGRR